MRNVASFAALALVALVAASCLQGPSERDAFVERGNEICRDWARELDALPPPGPPASASQRAYAERAATIGRDALRELEELEPPSELEAQRDALFALAREQQRDAAALSAVARRRAAAAARGRPDRAAARDFSRLVRQIEAQTARSRGLAGEIGWTECARVGADAR